jgi:hypothetical protein
MTEVDDHDLKRREEAKRDTHLDPAERWRLLQEAMTWAADEVGRDTPAGCLANQRRILAQMNADAKDR